MSIGKLEVGQQYIMNRPSGNSYTLHIIGICQDKLGKFKIIVQEEFPRRHSLVRRHFNSAKIVSPQYFYGLTIKIEETL